MLLVCLADVLRTKNDKPSKCQHWIGEASLLKWGTFYLTLKYTMRIENISTHLKIFILALLMGQTVRAQNFINDKNDWFRGFVVFTNEDTLRGEVQFEMQTNLLKLRFADGIIKTYTAHRISTFQFYDPLILLRRRLVTLPYSKKGNYEQPTFFHVMTEGNITLLYRENIKNSYIWDTKTLKNPDYVIYFLFEDGTIKPFNGTPKQLETYLPNHQEEVLDFANQRKLNPATPFDLMRIIEFYNQL